MSVLENLTEDEKYLIALLMDPSGVDQAEFCWSDTNNDDNLFRCYDYQVPWYRNDDKKQVDLSARAVGKSVSIQLRSFAFPFVCPGQEMLITAPEMIHLDPVTKYVEDRLTSVRLSREMLKTSATSTGFTHRPFEAKFRTGARIVGRIPQKDGKGVKGCMAAGTMVLTRAGMKPIEDVKVGDLVLTHMNRWRPVLNHYRYENADGYVIAGGGHRGLVTSDSHRMYGRRNSNPQRTRNLGRADWVGVYDEELAERYFFGSPTQFPAEDVPTRFADPDVMRIVGRYVADGHLTFAEKNGKRTSGRLHIIVSEQQLPDVEAFFADTTFKVSSRRRAHNGTYDVEFSDTELCRLVEQHFGRHADGKKLPVWLLGAEKKLQAAFLDGYLSGDGHWDQVKKRWTAGTASRSLAVSVRLLGQAVGYTGSLSWVDVKPNAMTDHPQRSWRVTLSASNRNAVVEDGIAWQKVRSVTPIEVPAVYDLTVEDDHSYIADGLISHNQHPMWLELDEGQDYPTPGYTELIETLKYGDEKARWRIHGVTRGPGDYFYKLTKMADWSVNRVTAMNRPDWTPEERISKAEMYGSREHPDYRRNILGLSADGQSPLFVLARLMATVDTNESSDYNSNVYTQIRLNDEFVRESGMPIEHLVDLPGSHKQFKRVWAGMDVGMTNHPTEILVFGAESKPGGDGERLRLVSRIHLERISGQDQLRVMGHLADFYNMNAFGMDRTGLGLPIFQVAQDPTMSSMSLAKSIRGYNFSEKIPVAFKPVEDPDEWVPPDERVILGNVLEYSSDQLRLLVDQGRIVLPWDIGLIKEFQGQSYYVKTSTTNPYGKKMFSLGSFHALDAARMAALAYSQEAVEKQLAVKLEYEPIMLTWADSPMGGDPMFDTW